MEFSWSKLQQWYRESPRRALEAAYRAALKIQDLEDQYFDGDIITNDGRYGSGTFTVIQTQLRNYLNTIRLKLLEYQLSNLAPGNWQTTVLNNPNSSDDITIANKLAVIDQCLARYQSVPMDLSTAESPPSREREKLLNKSRQVYSERSIIPVSILSTFKQLTSILFVPINSTEIGQEIAEEISETRRRAFAAIRFFVAIFILAITIQWGSKALIYSPLVDLLNPPQSLEIKFQNHFKTEVLEEFRSIQETIELENLLAEGQGIPVDRKQQSERLKTEVQKLVIEYNKKSLEGVKNLFADFTSAIVIYLIIRLGREQITIVKDFLYETLAGLTDSAKAFLIIVSTDTFVGYHSSDGWDAILKLLFAHFGLPENAILTDIFIATVPVFLDALFKFWIFQYLRRASPPTSAIYREMND